MNSNDPRLGRSISLEEIEILSRQYLGVEYKLTTIRAALKMMGVEGMEGRGSGGKGRALYYDPLMCWVVATVFYRRDEKPEQLMKIVAARQMFMDDRFPPDDGHRNLRNAAVYYSFVTDLEWGMDVRRVSKIVSDNPDALRLCLSHDGVLLSRSFAAYRQAVESWSRPVLPIEGDPDLRRVVFDTARQEQLEQLARMTVQHKTLMPVEANALRTIYQADFRL